MKHHLGKKVRVFTANLAGMKQYHNRSGVVVQYRTPIRVNRRDDCLPIEYRVQINEHVVLTLPEGCVY